MGLIWLLMDTCGYQLIPLPPNRLEIRSSWILGRIWDFGPKSWSTPPRLPEFWNKGSRRGSISWDPLVNWSHPKHASLPVLVQSNTSKFRTCAPQDLTLWGLLRFAHIIWQISLSGCNFAQTWSWGKFLAIYDHVLLEISSFLAFTYENLNPGKSRSKKCHEDPDLSRNPYHLLDLTWKCIKIPNDIQPGQRKQGLRDQKYNLISRECNEHRGLKRRLWVDPRVRRRFPKG